MSLSVWLVVALTSATPSTDVDAIAEAFVSARVAGGGSRVERHSGLDDVARHEARFRSRLREGSRSRPVATLAVRIRGVGYRAATFSAGFWQTSAPRLGNPSDVVASWTRVSPDFVNDVLGGDWTHLGIGVSEGAGGVVVALVVARDRAEDLRRLAARYADEDALRSAVYAASNAARGERGLPELTRDDRLDRAAQDHAEAMLAQGFYAHRSPAGTSPADRARAAGYPVRRAVAENIAKGAFSPEEAVERWLGSRGHRQNILRSGRWSLGVGIASRVTDEEVEVVWVQLFAR